jgi:hypothetical protein
MANTSGICVAFLQAILEGNVKLLASGGDTIKAALYETTATIGAQTPAYTTLNELTGTGYTAGGISATNQNPGVTASPGTSGNQAWWQPSNASFQWTGLTSAAAFDTLLLYDVTASNLAIAAFNFGTQNITAGTLTLTLPSNAQGSALVQLQY